MDTIYSITILDFTEKIYFLQKRPEFSFESALNMSWNIGKSIKANYLQEYIKKQYEFRLMDTIMTSTIKVKVSLLWEVCVIILYSSMIDLHLINLYNQRMIEALYGLCKTKKLKMDYLIKRYQEVNRVLDDTIFYLSPKVRIGIKADITFAGTNIQEHCVYFQKYNRAIPTLKTEMFHLSTKDFLKAKGEIVYHRNQNDKLNRTKFALNSFMADTFSVLKNNFQSQYISIENNYLEEKEKEKRTNDSNHQLRNNKNQGMNKSNISIKQEKSTVSSIESNNLSSPSISPEIITQQVLSVPCQSNSEIFSESKQKQKAFNNNKNNKTPNIEESLNSLKVVDINSVLNSINFNFDTQRNTNANNSNNKTEQSLNQNTTQKANISNDLFSNDFFNLIPMNNQQVVQFSDFKMSNNDGGDNNGNNRSQSQPKNTPQINNNQEVLPNIPDNKYQSPDVIHSQQQNLSSISNSNDDIINLELFSNNKPIKKGQISSTQSPRDLFNFNKGTAANQNKQNQSIDICNLNLIGIKEDTFNLKEIKKQVRCSIIEKGTLINTKGTYNDINYRGQLALELTSNFIIHNKTFLLKVNHSNWTDLNCFNKTISKSLVCEEGQDSYKLHCRDVRSMQRILEYSPNLKIIRPGADFQVTGAFKDQKYKLELICQMNENIYKQMRASQIIITIITKSSEIVINKTNNNNYKIEDKKMTYLIRDFHTNLRLFLGIIFKTEDSAFVQIVKVNYRYMDILPSSLNAEFSYIDDQGITRILDVAKKCMVEISFTP